MTLPGLLRLVGVLLAVTAAGSVALGLFSVVGTLQASGGPDASLGILMLFLGGAVQSFWQALAGAALALLCIAAARLLETAR
jgi:hypothetical protein